MTLSLVLGWLVLVVSSAGTVDELPRTTTATGHNNPTVKGEHSIDHTIDSSPREITNRPNSTNSRVIVQEKCFLYMAESTVDGAGLGIFTVGPRQRGEHIGWGGDPILPVNLNRIMRATGVTDESKRHAALMLRNYTWSARFGQGDATSEVLVLGIDSLMNSHLAAANAGPMAVENDTHGQVVALTTIPAGGEVWSYYGDHWFRGREDFLDSMPGSEDYEVAEELIHTALGKLMNGGQTPSSMNADIWELMKEWKLVLGEGERIWNAFPTTLEDAQKIASSGMSDFHQTTKTEKELNKDITARCIDTIRVVDGRAVATQNLTQGAIVTGSPLLHFMEGRRYLDTDLLEKCFGHTDSPVVLCPYAPGVTSMFPSSKEGTGTAATPNVKVQWAPNGHMHHKQSLHQDSPELLLSYTVPVAAVDFVALRDIAAGEDLVLQVDEHHHRSSLLAELWNSPLSLMSMILRTSEEQVDNPYPGHMETQCHPAILSYQVGQSEQQEQGLDWDTNERPLPCEIEDRYVDPMTASITYSVRIHNGGPGIGGVPRRYIRFVSVQDVVPLSIMPDAWKTYQQPEMDEL